MNNNKSLQFKVNNNLRLRKKEINTFKMKTLKRLYHAILKQLI